MTLHLVGLGLGSRDYLTLRALKVMDEADKLILDTYTSWIGDELLQELRKRFGGRLREAERRELEDEARRIVERAAREEVAVLVPGDPLVATTHISLLLEAARSGVPYTLTYGVSAYSAAASASGLQAYKFGRTTTIPRSGVGVESCYKVIAENMEHGLHTLVLLDTAEGGLTAPEALQMLRDAEEELGIGVAREDRLVVVLARLGEEGEARWAGTIGEALQRTHPPPPHMIVFPGELHFAEAEALQSLLGADKNVVERHRAVRHEGRRVRGYLEKAGRAFETLRVEVGGSEVERVLEVARSYLEDARDFLDRGEIFNALGAVAYCEGLLDALRMLGRVSFEWG